jgi:hypothetical protein
MEFLKVFLPDKEGRSAFLEQLPMIVLVMLGLGLYWSGVSFSEPPRISLVVARASNLSGTQLALLAIIVFTINVLLKPLQTFVVEILLGNWPTKFGRRFAITVIKWNQKRVRHL